MEEDDNRKRLWREGEYDEVEEGEEEEEDELLVDEEEDIDYGDIATMAASDTVTTFAPPAEEQFPPLHVPDTVNTSQMKPSYELTDGICVIKQACQMLAYLYHVVDAEPMTELFDGDTQQFDLVETPWFHSY
jgi:hypothetical protein